MSDIKKSYFFGDICIFEKDFISLYFILFLLFWGVIFIPILDHYFEQSCLFYAFSRGEI